MVAGFHKDFASVRLRLPSEMASEARAAALDEAPLWRLTGSTKKQGNKELRPSGLPITARQSGSGKRTSRLPIPTLLQHGPGDVVRIRGSTVVYKVVAVNSNLVTILVSNPQPDGQYLPFNPNSLQTVDESRLERANDP
ncbi:hypothetical protein MFIFM68171_08617 [Madurella fahalii]|uniref:Uncharacterized protein n=1 Tax=Madurella fahalii TaxID=1157608 RepID=A0ABQ0GKY2_9PEZI